jgi:hypothetical protein
VAEVEELRAAWGVLFVIQGGVDWPRPSVDVVVVVVLVVVGSPREGFGSMTSRL